MESLLPWYINNTLSPEERRKVETWLAAQPERAQLLTSYRQVNEIIQERSLQPVAPVVEQRIRERVRNQANTLAGHAPPSHWSWVIGFLLTVCVMMSLWFIFKPGVILEWSASGNQLTAFQVYRTVQDAQTFTLIYETKASPDQEQFTFVDLALWPGQSYGYQVVAVGADNQPVTSRIVVGETLNLVPAQVAILFTSLVVGYSGVILTNYTKSIKRKSYFGFV